MNPHHRKIDLQSPLDLEYLSSTIATAAQAKIDLHCPSDAQSSSDAFRARVNELVHQYVRDTLESALTSISINGLDVPADARSRLVLGSSRTAQEAESEEAYEAYDPTLANQLRDLYAKLETETTAVAELRRDAPRKAAAVYLEKLKAEMAASEKEVEERRAAAWASRVKTANGKEEQRKTGLEEVEVKRHDKVQRAWEGAQADLEILRGVTEAVAVLERAKVAAREVDAL